jgi:hypothetical protein
MVCSLLDIVFPPTSNADSWSSSSQPDAAPTTLQGQYKEGKTATIQRMNRVLDSCCLLEDNIAAFSVFLVYSHLFVTFLNLWTLYYCAHVY